MRTGARARARRLILLLCVIVYAIVGHRLFGAVAPEKFGTFSDSIYTVAPARRAFALGRFLAGMLCALWLCSSLFPFLALSCSVRDDRYCSGLALNSTQRRKTPRAFLALSCSSIGAALPSVRSHAGNRPLSDPARDERYGTREAIELLAVLVRPCPVHCLPT